MELKLVYSTWSPMVTKLLIVPYGIETWRSDGSSGRCELLIVPYGIETWHITHFILRLFLLLIVPYGIETVGNIMWQSVILTFNRTLWNWNREAFAALIDLTSLLIVPYGIETIHTRRDWSVFPAFNRTLWNWNNTVGSAGNETQCF